MGESAGKSTTDHSDGTGAEALSKPDRRHRIDRVGDWSITTTKAALNNPAITVAIGTVILFVIARVPAEIFYSRLGLKPEDAGLNSVQIFLQGIATVLVISLAVAVAYGVVLPLLNAAYYWLVRRAGRKILGPLNRQATPRWLWGRVERLLIGSDDHPERSATRRILKLGPLLITVLTLVLASLILVASAIKNSDAIRNGDDPKNGLTPWQARKVSVSWTSAPATIRLPSCRWLYYLGEGGGRVALFDAKTGSTYRLAGDTVQLSFPHCDPQGSP